MVRLKTAHKYFVFGALTILLIAYFGVGDLLGIGAGKYMVRLVVKGVWEQQPISDRLEIVDVGYEVLADEPIYFEPLGLFELGEAKIVYIVYDSSGEEVKRGSITFELSKQWQVKIKIHRLAEDDYKIRLELYQRKRVGIGWITISEEWVLKDEYELWVSVG